MFFPSRLARVYVLSLLGACGGPLPPGADAAPRSDLTAPAPEPPPCERVLSPDPGLASFVEEAASRWSLATGCSIELGDGGVPFEFSLDLPYGEGGRQAPGWTRADLQLVLIHARTNHVQRGETVDHELGHVLGGLHTETDGVLSGYPGRRDVIDQAALDTVCAALPCHWFRPEEP